MISASRVRSAPVLVVLSWFVIASSSAFADAPNGYYDTVDPGSPAALRATLHDVIEDHTRFPYTSSAPDTWDILEMADEDPNNFGNILDVYRNASYAKEGGGNSNYNREHTWPSSYGFPNDNSSNYPYTDCHGLFLCDDGYNSSRSNKPFRYCVTGCSELLTDPNNGQGGSGQSNWTSGSFTAGTWETWIGRRGDVARALLYLDVRYEGGVHGLTGVVEPDLILTDDEALIASSNTGSNELVAYMGMLSALLAWHLDDPVDDVERARNDAVFSFQGNRNPFIDHPEWVACLFSGSCNGDITAPDAPTGLIATGADGSVSLDWNDNSEADLDGYFVYRSEVSGGPYTALNSNPLSLSTYTDSTVTNGTTYYYVVTAIDTNLNESIDSQEASAQPTGGGGGPTVDPWINEFHYDNSGSDTGEFFEIAGPAGTSLSGWQLIGYNGNGGGTYATVNLSGTIPDQGGCLGTLAFSFTGMQNGAPDGLALVDSAGGVVEFISYEGTMTATNGPAAGMVSGNVGVSESSGTPAGWSLQKSGTGAQGADFTWQPPAVETRGAPNTGQTFDGCGGGGDITPPNAPNGVTASGR